MPKARGTLHPCKSVSLFKILKFNYFVLVALVYDDTQKHVKCVTCAAAFPNTWGQKWILYTGRNSHLNSADHSKAVSQIEAQERTRRRLQEEHEALLQPQSGRQPSALKEPRIPLQPSVDRSQINPVRPLDSDFWNSMSNDDFVIDAADEPEAQLRQNVSAQFDAWDSEIGGDFLGSVMQNLKINGADDS